MTTSRPIAIVLGYVVRYPVGGMTATFLNYLQGLRDLGYEPVFMEAALGPDDCYDVGAGVMTDDPSYGGAYLAEALAAAGLADVRWWFRGVAGDRGMTRDEAIATLEGADVLLNVGCATWCDEFRRAPVRVLVDCDAPFTQIRLAAGDEYLASIVDGHNVLATTGVNIVDGHGAVPLGDRQWLPTTPPVHVGSWRTTPPPHDGAWTTVTSWAKGTVTRWQGEAYGEKDVEYGRLLDLPSRVDVPLELAVASQAPTAELAAAGWRVVDPVPETRTVDAFRSYVERSRGELAVAKHAFVKARTGAVNDRSLGYLAAGRPVVCSDTGLDWLPIGAGLLPFTDADSAAAAIKTVEADPAEHAAAARKLAERLDAVTVLGDLLDRVGVSR